MYTYIYTEKCMEFYKEGNVITVNNGTTLNLSSAVYNHKAAVIVSQAASGEFVRLKFWSKGQATAGVTFTASAAGDDTAIFSSFTNNLIPVRLAEIDTTAATAPMKVILFN